MGSQWASEPSAAAWQLGEGARGAMLMSLEQQMQLSRQSSESAHTHTHATEGERRRKKNHLERQTSVAGALLSPRTQAHVRAPCGGMCFSVPKVTHLAFSRDLQEAPRTHVPVLSTSHKNNQPR